MSSLIVANYLETANPSLVVSREGFWVGYEEVKGMFPVGGDVGK
ncbi:MAG: hypothetical protein V7K72_09630 [Nostoc sp.]